MKYAGFWIRSIALIIDVIPITLVVFIAFYFFLGFDKTLYSFIDDRTLENQIKFIEQRNHIKVISFLLWIMVCVAMEASPWQGTWGKKLVGIRVVGKDGERLSFKRSLYRNLSKIISYFVLFLGFLWAAFKKNKQAWHDIANKTYVIQDEVD